MSHAEDIVEMAKDAERYRWLRHRMFRPWGDVSVRWFVYLDMPDPSATVELDGAIDAAMKQEQQ